MSILDPVTCGFVKIFSYNLFTEKHKLRRENSEDATHFKGRILQMQFQKFNKYFLNSTVSYKSFTDNFRVIVANVQALGKRYSLLKKELMDRFSLENWEILSSKKKDKHTVFNCKGCLEDLSYKTALGQFPIKQKSLKHKAKSDKYIFKERILSDKTNTIIADLDEQFQRDHKTTFTKQVKLMSSSCEKKTSDVARDIQKDVQKQWDETSVER